MKKISMLCATLVIAFCVAVPGIAADTIKIGVAGPHTGDLAPYGIPAMRAAQLVVNQANEQGGILGRQVELLIQDEQCNPNVATNAATRLVSDGVHAVMGHICSGATRAALGIYREARIPVMSPSATNPPLTQSGEYPNFFRTIASDDMQSKLAVDYALANLDVKKVAILHDRGDYGRGFADFARQALEGAGDVEIVMFEGITPGAMDYSSIIQRVRRTGADALIFGGYHPEASKLVTQMQRRRVNAIFISDDGVKDDSFLNVAGSAAEGAYATGPRDLSHLPLNQAAVAAFQSAYGAEPGAFFQEGYAATLALLNAIEKAGTTDYDAVVNALRSEYVDTPVGRIKFDDKGDAEGVGFSVFKVVDGAFVEMN